MGSRSTVAGFLSAAALALITAAAAHAQSAPPAGTVVDGSLKGKTLTFVSYGGIYQDGQVAALKEFVDKSGVKLLNDGPTEIAKLQAQVESGNVTWDVVDTDDFPPFVHCGKLFQKLDLTKLDVSHIPAGQVGECSVPAMNYGTVLMYKNATYKDNPPKDWKDFFDTTKFPGTRAIDGSGSPIGGLIEQAILADGGSVDNMTPADIDKGIAKIKAIGPDTIFWKTGAESQQLAESGEADMIIMWTGRAMTAVKNGAAYTPVWKDWLSSWISGIGRAKDTDASCADQRLSRQRSQEIWPSGRPARRSTPRRSPGGRFGRRFPDQRRNTPAGLPAEHRFWCISRPRPTSGRVAVTEPALNAR